MTDAEQRWMQHFEDYCYNELGGREPFGQEFTMAEQYANDMMEEEELDD